MKIDEEEIANNNMEKISNRKKSNGRKKKDKRKWKLENKKWRNLGIKNVRKR